MESGGRSSRQRAAAIHLGRSPHACLGSPKTQGVKLYLKPRTAGTTSPYFLADLFKAFTSIDPGEVDDATEDLIASVEEMLSPFGLNLGFGAEYHFSDRFSVGGEYGLRYLMSSTEFDEIDMKVSTNIGMTYAAITANFVF